MGDKTKHFGNLLLLSLFKILLTIGIAKAKVLPLPVKAFPTKSLLFKEKINEKNIREKFLSTFHPRYAREFSLVSQMVTSNQVDLNEPKVVLEFRNL